MIEKYKEFAAYLDTIDLSHYTRKELEALSKEINGVEIRPLAYQMGQLANQMKMVEFPELLGVHHFPALRSIDFLSEGKKRELDDFLVKIRIGNYIAGLGRFTPNVVMLKNYLVATGIAKEQYFLSCPVCGDGHISNLLGLEERHELEAVFPRLIPQNVQLSLKLH